MESKNISNQWNKLCNKFGKQKSYHALKKHYQDICSSGDIFINHMIDELFISGTLENITLESEYRDFYQHLIDEYLQQTISQFIEDGLQPDPFWAD